jgi:hypothetical protein
MRKLFFAGVAVAQIVVFSSPAGATAFAQLSITGATQAHARCPVTLPLVGFVGGAPNVPFEYWFVTVVDGVRVTRGKVRATMPATGLAKVADSLVIGGSTNATKANSVQVAALGLGESTPTLSNEAAFSITCGASIFSSSAMTTIGRQTSIGTNFSALAQTITLSVTQKAVTTAVGRGTSYPLTYSPLQVGYASYHVHLYTSEVVYNFARRVALLFDTTPVKDRSIHRALLKFDVSASQVDLDGTTDDFWSCAASIGVADASWSSATHLWIKGTFNGPNPGRIRGPAVAIDVTGIVADWTSGRVPNHGFLLKGEFEELGPLYEDVCLSTVENPSLEVTYH